MIDCRIRIAGQTGQALKRRYPWEENDAARQVELKNLLVFDAIGELDGSYPFVWEIKVFHVNYLSRRLSTNPLPTTPRVATMTFVYAQVHASGGHRRRMFLARSPRWPIEERTNIRINTLLCYNRWHHTTYENVLSMPIYDLSHWYVLTCEAHPESSARYIGTDSVHCSTETGDSMTCTGHRLIEAIRKNSLSKFGATTCEKLTSTSSKFSKVCKWG